MDKSTKKRTGSYYTPKTVVEFMIDYLGYDSDCSLTVLEPSAGDGRFLECLRKNNSKIAIDAIEIDDEKAKTLSRKYRSTSRIRIVNQDFLQFAQYKKNESYDLVIGNPPYINKKNMTRESLELLSWMVGNNSLSKSLCQNIWVGFILGAVKLVKKLGAIFFVLPFEFLQVNYAEALRCWLEERFNTIHVLAFEKRMFPEIEQETCLVYMSNRMDVHPTILYRKYSDLRTSSLIRESSIVRNKPLKKWSNAILNDDEIEILEKRYSNYKTVHSLGECSPGVVTAANNELILTKEECLKLEATDYVKPIVSRSSYLQNDVEINYELIDRLDLLQKKVYLLDLKYETNLPESLEKYLNCAGNKMRNGKKIKDSYKCSRRKPWYGVPLTQVGDVCFFKRYDQFPRLCLNSSKILTTDIAYNLRVDEKYDPKSIVFSFYNSFTLALCEFHCRYYGGGVAELTPKEFAALKIPFRKIDKEQWEYFAALMHNGARVQEIVHYVDPIVLKDWPQKEVEQVREIWKKLKDRRSNKR